MPLPLPLFPRVLSGANDPVVRVDSTDAAELNITVMEQKDSYEMYVGEVSLRLADLRDACESRLQAWYSLVNHEGIIHGEVELAIALNKNKIDLAPQKPYKFPHPLSHYFGHEMSGGGGADHNKATELELKYDDDDDEDEEAVVKGGGSAGGGGLMSKVTSMSSVVSRRLLSGPPRFVSGTRSGQQEEDPVPAEWLRPRPDVRHAANRGHGLPVRRHQRHVPQPHG